jgi:hypothetical protein
MSQQTMMNPAAPQIPMTRTQSIGSGGTAALSPGLGDAINGRESAEIIVSGSGDLSITKA